MEKIWEKNWPPQDPLYPPLPGEPVFNNLIEQARKHPGKTAINFYGRKITFNELNEASDNLAAALQEFGIQKGERVILYMENSPQFIISFYGILKSGGTAVPCNPMYKTDELEHILNDSEAKAIIMQDLLYPVFNSISSRNSIKNIIYTNVSDYLPDQPEIPVPESMLTEKTGIPGAIDFVELINGKTTAPAAPSIDMKNDPALLQYTSGTTGKPKGAMLTHHNIASHTRLIKHFYQYTENDTHLVILPMFHISGLDIAMNPALAAGGTLILFSRFDLVPILDTIQKHKVTVWVTITTINTAVINYPQINNYDLTSLRLVISGGAPVPVEVHKKWTEITGTVIAEGYGLSETVGGIIGNSHYKSSPGTIGSPLYYHDVMITHPEDDTKEVPAGEKGELWIKGPCVMAGYWKLPEETAKVLKNGWLKTGDIAVMDDDGCLSIVGRSKEMIKVSGYSVFLAEIDEFLHRHPAVAEAATIGVSHPYRGEEPKAFVVLKPGYENEVTEEEIIAWCREKMAAYKYPRQVQIVNELPKSGSGKILKRKLQE